jgi:putative membrane protein
MLALFAGTVLVFIATWARHDIPMKPWAVGGAMLLMLVFCIWHSWMVKGRNQTIAFFLIAWVLSWFFEFIGDNYAWWFGHYKYTNTLGPRLGGVPILIIITWAVIIYSSFMLIDWLVGIMGERRVRSWWGRGLWAVLVAAATATATVAWDMMVDPMATSRLWVEVAHTKPWWYWSTGGPYMRELKVWRGPGGIPIGNFVGWWLAPFFIVLIFYLLFQRENKISGKLVNNIPALIYFYMFLVVAVFVLEMNWFENGMNQVALIAVFTMGPLILLSFVKMFWDYT